MKYVGFCYDTGGWGGDLTGMLIVKTDDGWEAVAAHISSTSDWSRHDIQWHYDKRAVEGDTYEWAGRLTRDEVKSQFGEEL